MGCAFSKQSTDDYLPTPVQSGRRTTRLTTETRTLGTSNAAPPGAATTTPNAPSTFHASISRNSNAPSTPVPSAPATASSPVPNAREAAAAAAELRAKKQQQQQQPKKKSAGAAGLTDRQAEREEREAREVMQWN